MGYLFINVITVTYKDKCCNVESKVNDTENFYMVQSTFIPRDHAQSMKCISTDQILYKHQLTYATTPSLTIATMCLG